MDPKIVEQLDRLNKTLNDLFLFLLCKEGYSTEQIRAVVGKADNNRLALIRSGLSKKKNT